MGFSFRLSLFSLCRVTIEERPRRPHAQPLRGNQSGFGGVLWTLGAGPVKTGAESVGVLFLLVLRFFFFFFSFVEELHFFFF